MAMCEACGQANREGFRFCGPCGAQLDKAIAFLRRAAATAYLARAERLVSAAAS